MTESSYYLYTSPTLAEALDDIEYFVQGFLWCPEQQQQRLMMLDELLLVAKFAMDREQCKAREWSELDWEINAPKKAKTLTIDDLELEL